MVSGKPPQSGALWEAGATSPPCGGCTHCGPQTPLWGGHSAGYTESHHSLGLPEQGWPQRWQRSAVVGALTRMSAVTPASPPCARGAVLAQYPLSLSSAMSHGCDTSPGLESECDNGSSCCGTWGLTPTVCQHQALQCSGTMLLGGQGGQSPQPV